MTLSSFLVQDHVDTHLVDINRTFNISIAWMEQIRIRGMYTINIDLCIYLHTKNLALTPKCIFLYSLKAYLMGCAFDMYSQSWNGLSYSLLLFVYCFILPICVIFFSYIGIIYHTRTSRKGLFGDNECPKKQDSGKDFDRRLGRRQSSHTNQRVSLHIQRMELDEVFSYHTFI